MAAAPGQFVVAPLVQRIAGKSTVAFANCRRTSAVPRGGDGVTLACLAVARRIGSNARPSLIVDLRLEEDTAFIAEAGGAIPEGAATDLGDGAWALRPASGENSPSPEELLATLAAGPWAAVLVASSPVLAESDVPVPAVVACAASEAAVLVATTGLTSAADLATARQQLERAGARPLGVVMDDRLDTPLGRRMASSLDQLIGSRPLRRAGRLLAPFRWASRALAAASFLNARF
jgi:hypothetical protein